MTTVELEEEVRWFMTWHMEPEKIAKLVHSSPNALSKKFLRAGISDLYTIFAGADKVRASAQAKERRHRRAA